jgi:hypothetical protein
VEEQAFEFMDAVWKIEQIEEAHEASALRGAHEAGVQLLFVERMVEDVFAPQESWVQGIKLVRGSLRYCHLFLEERSDFMPASEWLPWWELSGPELGTEWGEASVEEWLSRGAQIAWEIAIARESRNAVNFVPLRALLADLQTFPGVLEFQLRPADAVFRVPEIEDEDRAEVIAWELTRWYLAALSNAFAWAGPESSSLVGVERLQAWRAKIESFHVVRVILEGGADSTLLRIANGYEGSARPGVAKKAVGTQTVLTAAARRLDAGDDGGIRLATSEEMKLYLPEEENGAVTAVEINMDIVRSA